MSSPASNVNETYLQTLRSELEVGDDAIFERLSADLLSKLLGDIPVYVSKTGSQFGADAGTSGSQGRRLRVECKRYKQTTRLDPRGLAGEVTEAVMRDELLETWVLMSTKSVSETERNLALKAGDSFGVPILVFDWTPPPAGDTLCPLAAICASWPDVVQQHLGLKAADAARALYPLVGTSIENLRKEVETWNIGFRNLRDISITKLAELWRDSAAAKSTLNQDAAGGRSTVSLIKRNGPLAALSEWWCHPVDARSPAVVTGSEGAGKTWVSLDWLTSHTDEIPIVLVFTASAFTQGFHFSEQTMKMRLAESLKTITDSPRDLHYWQERVRRLLSRPSTEGPTFIVFVDGLNQNPSVDWRSLSQVLQGPYFAGKVRLLVTVRNHYYSTVLREFKGLDGAPAQVQIGTYSDVELDEILQRHGMQREQLHRSLWALASVPRLFPLVVRLKDNIALQSDVTVSRLLFEYGRDVLSQRQNSTFTDDSWVEWLKNRAIAHRDRIVGAGRRQAMSMGEVEATVAGPTYNSDEVSRRLSDAIDGRFLRTEKAGTSPKLVLDESAAILGLGLVLLDEIYDIPTPTFESATAAIETWLEPIAAVDQATQILRAALAVRSVTDDADGHAGTSALMVAWINSQNPEPSLEADVRAFGDAMPVSMLAVVEHSLLPSQIAAEHYAVQSVRSLPETRTQEWGAIEACLCKWIGRVTIPNPSDLENPQHHAQSQQADLTSRLGTVAQGERVVLGESLVFDYSRDSLADKVPSILEGHDLSKFAAVFRKAAIREAVNVDYRSESWRGLRWLLQVGSAHLEAARIALVSLADAVFNFPTEAGLHPQLRNRAAANLLRLTGIPEHEVRAYEIDVRFLAGRDYQEEYLLNPANSFLRLEHRHLDAVLNSTAVPVGRRLDRVEEFLADPNVMLPADIERELLDSAQAFSFAGCHAHGQATVVEHKFEVLSKRLARFFPNALETITQRLLVELASRTDEAKYWSSLAAQQYVLIASPSQSQLFSELRSHMSKDAYEEHANAMCLQMELLYLPLDQQLRMLLTAEHYYLDADLVHVLQLATSDDLQRFYEQNTRDAERAGRLIFEILARRPQEIDAPFAEQLVQYLSHPDAELQRLALIALSLGAPSICGRALLAMNWHPNIADPVCSHYGSVAIAEASKHVPFQDVLPQVASWRWLDAAMIRGGKPNELELASQQIVSKLIEFSDGAPPFAGNLILHSPGQGELPRMTIEVTPENEADELEFLKRQSLSSSERAEKMNEFGQRASESIQRSRYKGFELYLQSFQTKSVAAAYEANPEVWQPLLVGVEDVSRTFENRVVAAEGLFLALCEVLLTREPAKGCLLWWALRKALRTRVNGLADVPEILHIPFRVQVSPEVDALRNTIASIEHCNSDADLFDLSIVVSANGQATWLQSVIDADLSSSEMWRRKRAIALAAYGVPRKVDEVVWLEGPVIGSNERFAANLSHWIVQGAFASHWWRRFVDAASQTEMYASWLIFASCADRRARVWIDEWRRTNRSSSELDRLRRIHLSWNEDLFAEKFRRKESQSPSLGDNLFGDGMPKAWLLLDSIGT